MWISHYEKMAQTLKKLIVQQHFQLLSPPQSWGLQFSLHQQKRKICISHYEKRKIIPPPKSELMLFLVLPVMENLHQPLCKICTQGRATW